MTAGSHSESLRRSVEVALQVFADDTHRELDALFERLSLAGEGHYKRDRIDGALMPVPDHELAHVAKLLLREPQMTGHRRAALQDAVWLFEGSPEIDKRTRRELARELSLSDLMYDPQRLRATLGRWWPALGDDDPMKALAGLLGHHSLSGLAALVDQHVFRNPGDWNQGLCLLGG